MIEIKRVITIIYGKLYSLFRLIKKGINIIEKKNEPMTQATVLLGLILVNFMPLKNLQKVNPTIYEIIETNNE